MKWFDPAAGSYALDSRLFTPPLPPQGDGEEQWTKVKLVG